MFLISLFVSPCSHSSQSDRLLVVSTLAPFLALMLLDTTVVGGHGVCILMPIMTPTDTKNASTMICPSQLEGLSNDSIFMSFFLKPSKNKVDKAVWCQ